MFQRAGDGVAVVASVGRPIIESAAAFAALINTPPAKTHEVVNRPVSRNAINCIGAAYRADVSDEKNSHIATSEVNRRQ
jgi:UDP-N-acetyl-D-mannosaminuronate dehydrogenase